MVIHGWALPQHRRGILFRGSRMPRFFEHNSNGGANDRLRGFMGFRRRLQFGRLAEPGKSPVGFVQMGSWPRFQGSRVDARQYALTLLAVIIAGVARWLMDSWLGESNFFFTFLIAVVFAAWIGGWRTALVATVLGTLLSWYCFVPPRFSFAGISQKNFAGVVIYSLICVLFNVFGEAMRQAQKQARAHADLLQITLGSIGDAVIATDRHGRITFLNQVAERLAGQTDAQAHGRPFAEVFQAIHEATQQPIDRQTLGAFLEEMTAASSRPMLLVGREGQTRPMDCNSAPLRDEAGKIVGHVLVFRDATERRQLERANAEKLQSARFLAAIIESSADAILSKSLEGNIQTWNAASERLFGYTAEEAIGRHISLLIPETRAHEEEEIIARLRANERIEQFDTERVGKDRRIIPVSLTISPIKDERGQVVGESKIVRDISDRKRAEEQSNRLTAELSEAARRKDEFLATLAHELRNPLAPIRSGLQILQLTGGTAEDAVEILKIMERQMDQMVRLVDDLLDVSRINHGKLEVRRTPTTLDVVIQSAVETSRPVIEEMNHELTVTLPQSPIPLDADLTRLAQVFLNLLNNAAKYGERDGHIWLTAEREGNEAVISVRDSGIGIAPEEQSRIFEMFSQADHSLAKAQGGLGIGLTLVRRIVELHGGHVTVHSEGLGKGSEFVVRLPIAPEVPHSPTPTATGSAMSQHRILVVDDNRDGATSLSKLLSLMGNETSSAFDGEEAVSAAMKFRPNVILLDIGLPKLNGYEACRQIREQANGRGIVIIAQTGWGKDEDRQRSREAGFDHHLVKPIDPHALMTILDAVPKVVRH